MPDSSQTALVLGGTGRTGSLVARNLHADYAHMLDWLTGTIASGNGLRPNDDVHRVTGVPPTRFADFARRSWSAREAR